MKARLTSSQYFSGTFLGIICHNMQHFTRFCFFGISHCMKGVFGKICVKRCLVQICKPPPGINPIKHEVPPGYFVSTLPNCAQCSTLCIISFCCTTIVNGFRGLEMALIMGARCTTWPSTTAGKWPPARTWKGWSTKIYATSTFLPGCLLPWSPAFFTWWLLPMLILRWVARQFFRNNEILSSGN